MLMESESAYDTFLKRTLKIQFGGKSHRVTQLHFFRWPDHGTPKHPDDLLAFMAFFRKTKKGLPLVHCSAGVGRSGTLVALDLIMDQLASGCSTIDIFSVVSHLRTQRVSMVQTEDQYVYLYDCVHSLLKQGSPAKNNNSTLEHSQNSSQEHLPENLL